MALFVTGELSEAISASRFVVGRKTDSWPSGRQRWLGKLIDGLEHDSELRVISLFKLRQLSRKLYISGQHHS